jgi:hypothetical protein
MIIPLQSHTTSTVLDFYFLEGNGNKLWKNVNMGCGQTASIINTITVCNPARNSKSFIAGNDMKME